MTGSGWIYALQASLWGLLMILTLGLVLPWRAAALERYKMRHSHYGDLQGSFEGRGWEFFKRGWWLWLLAWPSAFLLIPLPFIYAAFKAIEWRWWVSGVRVGEVHFESDMPKGALIDVYWKVIGWSILLSVAMGAWFSAVIGVAVASVDPSIATELKILTAMQQIWVLAALGIGYLLTALIAGAVTRMYLIRDVWARVAESITVHNLAAAENVVARGDAVSALGEGFANSLDVAGI
jgi:uncharacterized membrane protein YjgN (DUF898 family)